MDLLRSVEVFVTVADLGSFSRAAERLSLSNAAVTRNVASLEVAFGGRLLDRTTRKLRLTEAGQICLDHCRRILHELAMAQHAVGETATEPQGILRVTAASLYWTRVIAPRLPEFLRRYRNITMHVNLTEQQPELLAENYDVSLQFLPPPGQTMIVRRILTLRRVVCAAPGYLAEAGTPTAPEELAGHDCLIYARSAEPIEWRFLVRGEEVSVAPHGKLRSTDALTLREAALAGLGIVRTPLFLVEEDLSAGRLVPLLRDARSIDPDLCAVFPSRKLVPAKLRVFLDFLQSNFGEAS